MIENFHILKGTLYAKECRKVENKKKPSEPPWEFYSIKVETQVMLNGRTMTMIPELQLDKGVNYDGFEVGDHIEVRFYLTGKAINEKWYKSEAKAVHIGFSVIEGEAPRKRDEDVFVPPTQGNTGSFDDDSLPF